MKMYPKYKAIMQARGDKIDFSQILDDKGQLDWKHSKGKKILFERNNQKDFFICDDYFKATKNSSAYISLFYHDKQYKISTTSLKEGCFTFLEYDGWEYEIGQQIIKDNIDIIITDRKREKGKDKYKIYCNKCHFDSNSFYFHQEYKEEYWIDSNHIERLKFCPCCFGRIVKPGINDIYTTAPHLINYLINKDDGYKNTKCSNKIKNLKCPDCKRKLHTLLSNVYYFGNPCICNDGYSYPNRMIYYTVLELKEKTNNVEEWEREYSPEWIKPKRYDMYIKYNGIKYIIEMDGGIGHGNICNLDTETKKRIEIDKEKDKIAKEHGFIVIRIPCVLKFLIDIKDEIYNYLKNYFPVDVIDWNMVLDNSFRNIHKQICDDYENTNLNIKEISQKYHYSEVGIRAILRNGQKIGWCTIYKTGGLKYNKRSMSPEEVDNIKLADKLLLENPEISIEQIVKITGVSHDRLRNHWKSENLLEKSKKRGRGKPKEVYVYNDNGLIKKYNSTKELVTNSMNDFNIQFNAKNIQGVCVGRRKRYMGLYFSYTPLNDIN